MDFKALSAVSRNNNQTKPNTVSGVKPTGPQTGQVTTAEEEEIEITSSLAKMQAILDYIGHSTYFLPVDQENRFEQLFVSLERTEEVDEEEDVIEFETGDEDDESAEIADESDLPMIHIIRLNDTLNQPGETNKTENRDDTYTYQFFVSIPVNEIKNKPELFELIMAINQFVTIGSFGWSEHEGVYYRYCLISREPEIDSVLIVEIVQMISFFVSKFSEEIIKCSRGEERKGTISLLN